MNPQYIMARTNYIQWDDDDVHFVLDQHEHYYLKPLKICHFCFSCISSVMVSMLASNWEINENGICCFYTKHTVLGSKSKDW
jgi:hypothetical protein